MQSQISTIYSRNLQNDSKECEALIAALSIKLSYFMRDEMAFDALERLAIRPLIDRLHQENKRKVALWSAGCSSGEEPYSLAILLKYILGEQINYWSVQLDGTDINAFLLMQAKTAAYTENSFHDTQKEYLKDFFDYKDGMYYLDTSIRTMVTWHLGQYHPVTIVFAL